MTKALFELGDVVYFVLKQEYDPGMITGVIHRQGCTSYEVTWSDRSESWHRAPELTNTFEPEYWTGQGQQESKEE